jgi:predicted DCC family thiol-disulfide oxidoreductase YuxK
MTRDLTVLYDGSCSLCRGSIARLRRWDTRNRVEALDLHDPSAQIRFPKIDREKAMLWMQAIDAQGHVWSGAEAWAHIGLRLPALKWFAWLLLVPGIRWVAAKAYGWVARNRYRWNSSSCEDGTCAVHLPTNPSSKS